MILEWFTPRSTVNEEIKMSFLEKKKKLNG